MNKKVPPQAMIAASEPQNRFQNNLEQRLVEKMTTSICKKKDSYVKSECKFIMHLFCLLILCTPCCFLLKK